MAPSPAVGIVPSLSYNVDARCNMDCEYCPPYYENYQETGPPLSDEAASSVFLGAADAGIVTFRLSGGEPLLRGGHVVAIASSVRREATDVEFRLNTNGSRLQKQLAALRVAGVDVLKVSVDTLDRQKFKDLTGYGRLDLILDGVLAAAALGMTVELNMVYTKKTAADVQDLIDFSVRHSLAGLKILDLVEYDDPEYFSQSYLNPGPLLEELEARYGPPVEQRLSSDRGVPMLEFRAAASTRVLVKDCRQGTTYSKTFCSGCSLFPCQEGFYNMTLNSDGRLKPCRLVADRFVELGQHPEGASQATIRAHASQAVSDLIDRYYADVFFAKAWSPPLELTDASPHAGDSSRSTAGQ